MVNFKLIFVVGWIMDSWRFSLTNLHDYFRMLSTLGWIFALPLTNTWLPRFRKIESSSIASTSSISNLEGGPEVWGGGPVEAEA